MAQNTELEPHKRKRNDDDNGNQGVHPDRIPQPPPPQSGQSVPINYLSQAPEKLKLIHGDGDTFSDVLTLINEYEGVLNRHESLASNLGAKLTGPRLLKAIGSLFEGSITTIPTQTLTTPDRVTWLDIVEFAKTHPGSFVLTTSATGVRSCQFPLKGVQVEIIEDDWRLIVSGAVETFKMTPTQPLEADEAAESATLDILDQRLQVLIKKADEVAHRARMLNYHLSGRRAAIKSRRPSTMRFQAVNQPVPGSTASPGYDLHADLLQQFLAPAQSPRHRLSSFGSIPPTPGLPTTTTGLSTPKPSLPQQVLSSASSRPSPGYQSEPIHRDLEEEHRALVTTRMEKLARGDAIHPACDRCRRLKVACLKHLTACQGCTKKHARCTWKTITIEEIADLKKEADEGNGQGDEKPGPPHRAERGETGQNFRRSEDTVRTEPRIAIIRTADELWRKGPRRSSNQETTDMDVDAKDTREPHRAASEVFSLRGQSEPDRISEDQSRLTQMAYLASARTETANLSRGSPQGS